MVQQLGADHGLKIYANVIVPALEYDPNQFTISHFVELLVANIVACAGIGGKTARLKVVAYGF